MAHKQKKKRTEIGKFLQPKLGAKKNKVLTSAERIAALKKIDAKKKKKK